MPCAALPSATLFGLDLLHCREVSEIELEHEGAEAGALVGVGCGLGSEGADFGAAAGGFPGTIPRTAAR